MNENKQNHKSETIAYELLLERAWANAPGIPSSAQASSEQMLVNYLNNPDKISNVAIGLGFIADEELLLASNLLGKGDLSSAWKSFDKAQAYAFLSYEISDHVLWRPSRYSRQVFDFEYFCTHFSLALARGSETSIRWYAQQVYNVIQGGLADNCCAATEYVDLYFDMAVTILNNEWRHSDRLNERMEVYRDLFLSTDNPESVTKALNVCAQYHLELATTTSDSDENSVHPFKVRAIGHIAYELMGWMALYKRFFGILDGSGIHPMLLPAFCAMEPQKPYSDATIEQVVITAKTAIGSAWENPNPPNIDEMI